MPTFLDHSTDFTSEVKVKIFDAQQACREVSQFASTAFLELQKPFDLDGFGIFKSPDAVRERLELAQVALAHALRDLKQVRFPTDSDYDAL